ncbi:MAG: DUF3810 family protein [Acidobacteria bacterium]|nr:DUF3810 family protein [Acidobacteriota bacterium]MBI3426051.1 DUF3810 family protein [Acidobacteriota bacterium]
MRRDSQKLRAVDAEASEELEGAEAIEREISSPGRWSQGIIILLGAFGLQRLLSFTPELVERFYSRIFFQSVARIIAIINKPFGFSLAEAGLIVLVILLSIWLLWVARKFWHGFLGFFDLIAYLLYRAIWAGGLVMLLFLALWGFNYQRQTLAANLNLAGRETRPGELETICNLMISRLNSSYEMTRLKQDWASDKGLPISRPQLYDALETSYQSLSMLGRASQAGFGPPKPLTLSPLLSRFGISGIYSPFTGEANYNEEAPACDLPYVIAHEKAHQRGFAREDEANFIGFLACVNATDAFVRYSGYLQAMPRVMSVLATTNADEYQTLLARIGPGARTDLQTRAAFWHQRESRVLGEVARKTNNTYLKANRVRSGIANYDEVTALIINYFLAYPNGGRERLLVTETPAASASPETTASKPRQTPTPPAARPTASPSPAAGQSDPGGFIP